MINRVYKLLPCLAVLAALFSTGAQAQGVLRVATLDDLRRIGKDDAHPLHASYELTCDIDATPTRALPFEPIGDNVRPFTGRFYGKAAAGGVYVIRNLYVSRPTAGYAGLFGVVGYDAEVANVGVVADSVIGHYAVGTIAGVNNGAIVNCYGSGAVVASRAESNAGGLVGVNGGIIAKSYSTASVDGRENVGGLVGILSASAGEISECFALGGVSGSAAVGGLVGLAFGGRIGDSFSGGMVTRKGGTGLVGGLVGKDFASSPPWNDRGIFEVDGVAYYIEAVSVRASFWDVGATRIGVSAAGEGKTNAEMMSRGTFSSWDFDGTWSIAEGVHYPQLAAMPIFTHTLFYSVDNEECGRLSVSSGSGAYVESYEYSMVLLPDAVGLTVKAVPWEGCRFVGWSDGAKNPSRVDTAAGAAAFTALFSRDSAGAPARTYAYAAETGGMVRVGGVSGLVAAADTAVAGARAVVASAAPDSGYRFVGWSDGIQSLVRSDTARGGAKAAALFFGESSAPIKVSSYDDLFLIGRYSAYPLHGSYELVSDIDLSTRTGFEPIGGEFTPFTGVFRGNGYKIHGVRLHHAERDFIGLFAYAENAVISGVRVEAFIAGRQNVGALAGMCVNTLIDSCVVEGMVSGALSTGGLIGRSVNSLISRTYSSVSVDGAGYYTGGLVGVGTNSFIAQSYFAGSVQGTEFVGGAIGRAYGGQVQHSYSAGGVAGVGRSGGFIGEVDGGANVLQCYSSGAVIGAGISVGGFSGMLGAEGGAVSACYWDITRSGKSASAGGRGKTPAEMALRSTYIGWDFEGVWDIDKGYPQLRGLAAAFTPDLFFEQAHLPSPTAHRPLVKVVGRTLHISALAIAPVQIRIIDIKGKTVAKYNTVGGAKISINKIPSGKYIVEAASRSKRVSVSRVRILK